MRRALVVSVMIFCWCAGIASGQSSPSAADTRPAASSVPRSTLPIDEAYRVGPKDMLAVEVWNRVEVEYERRELVVERSGTIYTPLVEEVHVGGLTVPEITEKLRGLYADYIKNPQVFVLITEYNARAVTIIGEVREDTRLVLKGETRLMEALAEAGGETDSASEMCRVVRRGKGGTQQIFDVNLGAINAGDASQNVLLEDGDTLIVMPNKDVIFVTGFVNQAGQYDYAAGLTAQQAVIMAGGISDGGAGGRAKVFRPDGTGRQREFKTNVKKPKQSFPLKPGDIVDVPASWL